MRPSKPTYEKEDATHLVTALKDSQDEVDRLRAELKAAKEKEDRVTVELKEAKEKEAGVRVVLDRFEEELCCGICQESFIDVSLTCP
jgi:septal ring factor EnvC (AmiA/AmiB activator)